MGTLRDGTGLFELGAQVNHEGGVATVVEDQIGALPVRPVQNPRGRPPILVDRLALPGEHRYAPRVVRASVGTTDHRGSSVVLGRKDVATGPPHIGAEGDECLDEHRGLDSHVKRPGDAGPGEGLLVGVFGP